MRRELKVIKREPWLSRIAGVLFAVVIGTSVGASGQSGGVSGPDSSKPSSPPGSSGEVPYQGPGTKKMAALLKKIYRESDWTADPNKPGERVGYYRGLLTKGLGFADEVLVREEMAKEMLRVGDSEAAVDALEELRRLAKESKQKLSTEAEQQLGEWLAMSYLRLGEQENCLHMHGQKSCIFPIRGSGIHSLPRGAEGAVRELTALLMSNQKDYESRWLLNVAYMQLGRYPAEVPKRWLISSKLFDSEQDIGEFPDYASRAGLDVKGMLGERLWRTSTAMGGSTSWSLRRARWIRCTCITTMETGLLAMSQ